jgi:hypothetical protein
MRSRVIEGEAMTAAAVIEYRLQEEKKEKMQLQMQV